MAVRWPDEVDDVMAGDQAVAFGQTTPAGGVVLTPLTNVGLRDREAGRAQPVTSSIGMWRKLERLRARPRVAIAYHAREHGFSRRPEYVLVQGTATLTELDDPSWIERHREAWERFVGPRDVGPLWERWLSVYHRRVGVGLDVERIVVWPDLECRGVPEVHGPPLPPPGPPQAAPAKGTGPRVAHRRAARRAARRPHVLLGWTGADGFPVIVPVRVAGAVENGIALEAPADVVPPGGRRAGLLAHSFARYTRGQHKHQHTGWLESRDGRLVYAPHTEAGYWLPASWVLYRTASGFVTRRGLRAARRAGFVA
jgi:hypothetical protein